jgi:hypothetical protein
MKSRNNTKITEFDLSNFDDPSFALSPIMLNLPAKQNLGDQEPEDEDTELNK